jgi:hypothetical protein
VIAEQIPARLVADVIKNTAVKIVHRLPAADDREAVGSAINATPARSRYLVTLPPGRAAAFADGMDFPVLIQAKDGTRRERAQPATSGPRSLVRPRAASCGTECAARPCTLRDMRSAQQVLHDQPWAGLWAGLAVLAHLTGWPAPVPLPDVLAAVTALPVRTIQCTISHAADTAVSAHPLIPRPRTLAAHVSAMMGARAERGEWLCTAEEPEWLLPAPVSRGVAGGLLQAIAGGQAAFLPGLLGSFIDCRWPLEYLRADQPPD